MIQIDIPMPKCCNECFALDDHGDYPYCSISHDQRGYNFNVLDNRMPTCPLKTQEPVYIEERLVFDKLRDIQEYARVNEINWMADGAAFTETVIGLLQGKIDNLLKVQEPRVLTLDEAIEAPYVWIENMLNCEVDICRIMPTNNKRIVDVQTFGSRDQHIFKVTYYNRLWRCWSSCPTYKQRDKIKWD